MSVFKFLGKRKTSSNCLLLILLSLYLVSGEASACTSTIINTSPSSTATLQDTGNGQCLINQGTISPTSGGYGINSSYNNFSMLNTGTINLTGPGASAMTTAGGNSPLNPEGSIENSGAIFASGSDAIYGLPTL